MYAFYCKLRNTSGNNNNVTTTKGTLYVNFGFLVLIFVLLKINIAKWSHIINFKVKICANQITVTMGRAEWKRDLLTIYFAIVINQE